MAMETKEFGAKIPKKLYDEFRELFPMYGATTWFIMSSMEAFIAEVRNNGTLQKQVTQSIERMLEERRNTGENNK